MPKASRANSTSSGSSSRHGYSWIACWSAMSDEPTRAMRDDRVGTMFGEYRIESLIGVGGMGKVYRATVGGDTPVALKVVKEDLARDETFRRRFRREARIAQSVRNPHVVPVR